MNSDSHVNDPKKPSEARSKPAWFATFTALDASGAISSAQFQRLIAPFTKLWQKTFGKAV